MCTIGRLLFQTLVVGSKVQLHTVWGKILQKSFEINFENDKGEKAMVWQNSWAYSTRTIGVMVMVDGDDKGLVLPPKVAAIQVIVIPVPYKDADTKGIYDACDATVETLTKAGVHAEADFRDNYSPGWKYSHWEMKGVPRRIEIGPKDLANEQEVEKDVKARTKGEIGAAKTLCSPFEQPALGEGKPLLFLVMIVLITFGVLLCSQ
ncbi:hypothetical protein RHGRI_009316 [Rhododendron griersonianum]|uniref:Anticodon-binding domain-containing protein n=1 Tax=Rhododendron griersonianum TaxID=479676 RepID=A0AAV6KEV4_9ERIC|nr:hypothetical protein RHGRI_009316 [Rhododendron griersonianum]